MWKEGNNERKGGRKGRGREKGSRVSFWDVIEKKIQRMRLTLLCPKILQTVHSFILSFTLPSLPYGRWRNLGPIKINTALICEDLTPNTDGNQRHGSTVNSECRMGAILLPDSKKVTSDETTDPRLSFSLFTQPRPPSHNWSQQVSRQLNSDSFNFFCELLSMVNIFLF